MKISDKALGYISLIALLCVFGIIAYSMWKAHHEASSIILVDFDELGTLQPEDQVVIRGYTVGSIGKVEWLGDRARVQVKLKQPIIIREGTQFNNTSYALMGQRALEIIPSKTGNILPLNYVHTGTFEPGLAETLRHIEKVNEQVATIREVVHLIVNGSESQNSIATIFEDAISGIETSLANTEQTLRTLQPALNTLFNKVDTASSNLMNITVQADSAIRTATNVINDKLTLAENAMVTISEGAKKTNDIITSLDTLALHSKILYSSETIDNVNQLVTKLNELVRAIDTKGIKMLDDNGNPIKAFTWKNINLIGKTARQKAKERAKEAQNKSNETKAK